MELVASEPDEASKRLLELIKYHQDNHQADACRQEYEEVILSTGLYRSAEHDFNKGLIRRDDREIAFQRVRVSILNIIERIPKQVFDLPEGVKKQLLADKLKKDELSEKASLIASQSRHEYDLFFSFSSANIEAAKTVVARLRGHGLRVFFSDETLKHKVGESFDRMINHALENSSHFVWFCTPESAASSWVELEYTAFFNHVHLPDQRNRKFFILRGKDFEIKHVPITYRTRQFADDEEQIIANLPRAEAATTNIEASRHNKETDKEKPVRVQPEKSVDIGQQQAGKDEKKIAALNEERLRLEQKAHELMLKEERLAAAENERLRVEAEAARRSREQSAEKRKQQESAYSDPGREAADHTMFYLARTIPAFENYLSNGYLLHEKEAREKIAELKQLEMQQTKQSPPAIKKSNRDFYEVLDVRPTADATELEKAYTEKKRVVLAGSEEDQELQEAYRVLANKDLRTRYDRYGHQGIYGEILDSDKKSMDDILRDLGLNSEDAFSRIFRSPGKKGSDIRIKLNVTEKEIKEGFEKKIKVRKQVVCNACSGKGLENNGSGTNCPICGGSGRVFGEEIIPISITSKEAQRITQGAQLSLPRLGNAGENGGAAGDLLVTFAEVG